ncbi:MULTISPECIES: quinolinate synthase NadA [unclassified Rhodanobacter]|uniref:quinolinate synthase NadA n=1 Tax=unclassified Rhodanobacter TaxID=2621553 RepID=UPI0009861221|nr:MULTISPECIES: quinolinate synthase NadA [unclassified Rhodanobacter]OOG38555.1 quinolinate synthase [Rhodanobacter sp. C05]OOG50106.1 quinolinate synthase [Rhodanobacter sp. C01]OOG52292.1 quinolinate synthase [Rhodanobacter sp. C03]OOG65977.1 quinolinate synthase [Rhodanobacter sp. B04]
MTDPDTLPLPIWRDALEHEYAELGARLEHLVPCLEWPFHLPWIEAINRLKKQRGAVIMAHSYQSAEIFHGVADVTGDSLALAQAAADCEGRLIVLCGVHFMAESAKILAPEKTVLIPDLEAGCSLAASITAADVRALRAKYPGVPVVSYVNTSAEVKAESDACCTSANAVEVVEAMGTNQVIFLPDRFLGNYVASKTKVELLLWTGRCEVHEKFTAQQARHAREYFHAKLIAHPECPPEVWAEADFVGSTSAMVRWLAKERPERVALITECSMADNLRAQFPATEFIKPCNLCPHMQRITLQKIYTCLRDLRHEVRVPTDIAVRARTALMRMLAIGRQETI